MNNKLYKLMNWPVIEEIIYSETSKPHETLGAHVVGNQTLIQAYFPDAKEVLLHLPGEAKAKKMDLADDDGFFAALVTGKNIGKYFYEIKYKDGRKEECVYDPYSFEPMITDSDIEKFENGIHYTVYEKLGAHVREVDGVKGVHFAVWAPNAMRISVVGDFNQWDGRVHQMRRLGDCGIFELFIPIAKENDNYKFEIKLKTGLTYLKADPYANASQLRPDSASVVADVDDFKWEDQKWIKNREKKQAVNAPMSVYELYLGSFARNEEGNEADGSVYVNYRELAPKVIAYVKEMGYTHVELMPVMEHPFDGSWGYQTIGYYSPTARYGTPKDFMFFMNELHKADIGVILDWVPAHFPRDAYGLSNFDGTCLYEHLDPRQGAHPHWGTLIYNYGRPQVSNYLIANALFWVEKYHADGIRMDAVASMLYLDYGKQDGEWVANMYGGNENLEAMEFIKHLNSIMHKRNPGVMTIAEESTAWPMVTGKLEDGGLGFDYKWNMGWMNDYLGYIKYDPYFRSHHHSELTFSMIYAYSEKFMLVFSHDEVVHGKASMLGKMPGSREEKFANLRLTYAYMMMHPGRKLLFMGQDIGEFDEWNENRSVQWNLLEYPEHAGVNQLIKSLNKLYCTKTALHAYDSDAEGFEWINCISYEKSYLAFMRKAKKTEETLYVVANFAGVEQNIQIGVPYEGKYIELLNTNDENFGGTGKASDRQPRRTVERKYDERPYMIDIPMPALSLSVFTYEPYTEEELEEIEQQKRDELKRKALEEQEKLRKEQERLKEMEEKLAQEVLKLEQEEKAAKAKRTAKPAAKKTTAKTTKTEPAKTKKQEK